MTEETKKVVKILRSLIISSPQRGKSLRELVRDYHEFEGHKIPIFGHRTVEEFLRSTGEFIIENFRGELIIYEKPNEGSLHIAKLVAEQNKSKKRAAISSRFGHSLRQPNFPQQRIAYPARSPQKSIFPGRSYNTGPRINPVQQRPSVEYSFDKLGSQKPINPSTNGNMSNEKIQTSSQNAQPSDLRSRINEIQREKTNSPDSQQFDLRNRINGIQRPKLSTPIIDLTGDSESDGPNSRFPSVAQFRRKTPPNSPKKNESQDRKDSPQTSAFVRPPLLPNNPFFNSSIPPPNIQISRMQDRLKKVDTQSQNNNVTIDSNNRNVQNLSRTVVNERNERKSVQDRLETARQLVSTVKTMPSEQSSNTPVVPPSPNTPSSPTIESNEGRLFEYCNVNGLNIPKFKLFKVDNRFQCHVTIDNIRYSTYPTDYANQNEARAETSKHALERLIAIQQQQQYDVCLDNETELANKIYTLLKDYPTGVFSKKIPETFLSLYRQLLPNNWMTTLEKHPECFTIERCIDDHIVYVVEAAEPVQKMDKLQLPWNEEYWSLIITCAVSTAEVWGRLIGKEHSNALDSLVTDIELELLKNRQVPSTFNVGQIYLVLMNECAYRVRVEKIDETQQRCLCFGVDEGDTRWYNMNEMYLSQNKFLKLAPQAIRFQLHGMEDFDDSVFAKQHLEDTLLNSPPLIGQIFTKKDDFIAQDESSDLTAVIQVVLYDTSTPEDVNLHQVMIKKICEDIRAPELQSNLTQVVVSHISDAGDIFIQIDQNGVHYVNKLIHKLTQQANVANHTLPSINSSNNNLFLVFDEETHKWCRGKFIKEAKELKANEMLLVDYGKTKSVPLAKIYRLESLSQALLTYPPQAIQVKLNGLTDFPEHLVSILRGYFSGDNSAIVMKTSISATIPEVKLYFFKDKCMINVNDSIEMELQRSNETSFSRQSSITSNPSRDTTAPDELSNFDNLSLKGRKLQRFQPPEVNGYFDVEVVMVATPSNFQIRPIKHMPEWVRQMKHLQDHCNNSPSSMTSNMIREGEVYACLHSDGKWYRAIVECQLHTKSVVCFCDLGDIDSIDDPKRFKVLPDEYRDLPKLAINARLFGIKPMAADWEMDDIVNFNQMVTGKKFQAIVAKITEKEKSDMNAQLDIWLIDVSNDSDDCINNKFVEWKRAVFC